MKMYVDMSGYQGVHQNTSVAHGAEMLVQEFLKQDGLELTLGGLKNHGRSFLRTQWFKYVVRQAQSYGHIYLGLRNPDSLIVPMNAYTLFYDIIPFQVNTGVKREYFRCVYRSWLTKSRKVFVFSKTMLTELKQLGRIRGLEDRVEIIPPFLDNEMLLLSQKKMKRVSAHEKYVLGFGTGEPRKNIARTLDLYEKIRSLDPAIKLYLYGGSWRGIGHSLVQDELRRRAMSEHDVVQMGRVSTRDLVSLYQHSIAFLFPSMYEGIGLPPFEALLCGTKVIISDIDVFREYLFDYPNVYVVKLDDYSNDVAVSMQVLEDTAHDFNLTTSIGALSAKRSAQLVIQGIREDHCR